MSLLNPPIIRFGSFKCKADVPLCPANSVMTGWKDPKVDLTGIVRNFLERECNSTVATEIHDYVEKKKTLLMK